ncbi:hypothetical protein BKA93DRAFT_878691 [Sparassis latifolia]
MLEISGEIMQNAICHTSRALNHVGNRSNWFRFPFHSQQIRSETIPHLIFNVNSSHGRWNLQDTNTEGSLVNSTVAFPSYAGDVCGDFLRGIYQTLCAASRAEVREERLRYKFTLASDVRTKICRRLDAALFLSSDVPLDGSSFWAWRAISFTFIIERQDPFHWRETSDASCERHHRSFIFAVLILGHCARILRWDRAPRGVSMVLLTFVEGEKCYDSTVTAIEKDSHGDNLTQNLAVLETGDYTRRLFKDSLNEYMTGGRIDKGESDAELSKTPLPMVARFFLIGKLHFETPVIARRHTCGYVAVNCETETLVFLKDTWRVGLHGFKREGIVLRILNAHEAVNFYTLVYHGNVPGHSTMTQELSGHHSEVEKVAHYRLVGLS